MKQLIAKISGSGVWIIILAYIAFISLGLPDGLLGVAWPSLREDFARPLDSLGLLLAASISGYLVSSFYGGKVTSHLGVGWVLSLSCAATAIAMIGYTIVPYWWMIILLSFISGMGGGAIDTGINSYMAANYGERLMQWLHASFGIGITAGPLLMTAGITYLNTWHFGYRIAGIFQLLLSACFAAAAGIWQGRSSLSNGDEDLKLTDYKTSIKETLKQLNVWISVLLFFIYTGIELSLGTWAYTLLTESRKVSAELAGFWVGSYWGAFTAGRILAGAITKRVKIINLIRISIISAFAGSLLLMLNINQYLSLAGVTITGFAIAPIFPGLVSLTQKRVGVRYAANTIGFQFSAGAIGSALIPAFAGIIARQTSLEVIPLILMILVTLLYGLYIFSAHRGSVT